MSPYENLHPAVLAHVRTRDLGGVGEMSGYALTCIAERLGVPLYREIDPADAEQPAVGARKSRPARPIACGRHSFTDDAPQQHELVEFARSVQKEFAHVNDRILRDVVNGARFGVRISPELAAAVLRGRKLMQEFGP